MKTKTTLYLNNALYRRAKIKALEEGRTVSELIEEGLLIAMGQNGLGSGGMESNLPPPAASLDSSQA